MRIRKLKEIRERAENFGKSLTPLQLLTRMMETEFRGEFEGVFDGHKNGRDGTFCSGGYMLQEYTLREDPKYMLYMKLIGPSASGWFSEKEHFWFDRFRNRSIFDETQLSAYRWDEMLQISLRMNEHKLKLLSRELKRKPRTTWLEDKTIEAIDLQVGLEEKNDGDLIKMIDQASGECPKVRITLPYRYYIGNLKKEYVLNCIDR
jgi:hypothetical protein